MSTQDPAAAAPRAGLDLATLIDESPMKGFQYGVIACCAAVAFFDGIDTQSIGVAAPFIAKAFALPRGALGPIISAGQIGAAIGAIAAGALADRFGRKPSLIGAILLMTLGTLATAFSREIPVFIVARLVAGLGLGAAVPCAIALTAEYAPARVRGLTVSIMWAAFPLGGFLGGLINPLLAQGFGWPAIFIFGGIVPIVMAVACAFIPESLRYLAARNVSADRIRPIVRRLSAAAADAEHFIFTEPTRHRGSVLALFGDGRALLTLLLWLLAMVTFSGLVFLPLWAPTLLSRPGGLSLTQAGIVVSMSNLGSVIGTASFGRLFDRFGTARVMSVAYAIAAAAFALGAWSGGGFPVACAVAFISCMCLGGSSGGVLNLAASSYPTVLRSTGVGAAVATSRVGQIGLTFWVSGLLAAGWTAGGVYLTVTAAVVVACVAALRMPKRQEA